METTIRESFLQTLLFVLAVHVTAFVLFHLHAGMLFDIRFFHLRLEYRWLRTIVAAMNFLALYAPIGIFAWLAFTKRYNVPLLLLMAVVRAVRSQLPDDQKLPRYDPCPS